MSKNRVTQKGSSSNHDVRPIGARALKSAIDTLRPYLHEAHVLDLFAGQGRFGFACSQEAIKCLTFVEKNRATGAELSKLLNSKSFPKAVKGEVILEDALGYLARCSITFDVIFADPPFPLWNETFQNQLFSGVSRLLKDESIFLVKHPSRVLLSPLTDEWNLVKQTEFGESQLLYFTYEAAQNKTDRS